MGEKVSFDYQYNAQISADEDNQVIVGQHVSQNTNDKQEIEPALVAIKDAKTGSSEKCQFILHI